MRRRIFNVAVCAFVLALILIRCIEDGEYIAFGRQFDNDYSGVDFGDGIGADL